MPIRNGVIKPLPRSQVPSWFGRHCDAANMSSASVPILGRAYVHNRIAEALRGVLAAVSDAGKANLIDRGDYGGTYNCRRVRGGSSYSPHAWAIAIDLNVHHFAGGHGGDEKRGRTNYRCAANEIAPSLTTLAHYFNAWGFSWGGHWSSFKDPMHYEATELTVRLMESGLSADEEMALNNARRPIGLPLVGSTAGHAWSKPAREWAITQKLITGYGGGNYGWQEPVTREEFAVILKRYNDLD